MENKVVSVVLQCPKCGFVNSEQLEECPECGISLRTEDLIELSQEAFIKEMLEEVVET